MANILGREVYTNAVIDIEDMTITEYDNDECKVFDIFELLKRWDGISRVTLIIESVKTIPPYEGSVVLR